MSFEEIAQTILNYTFHMIAECKEAYIKFILPSLGVVEYLFQDAEINWIGMNRLLPP